ncbi:MAG: hypothetical protein ACREBA_12020, partial [Nitrosotalea sp.]
MQDAARNSISPIDGNLSVFVLCFPTYIVNRIIFNFATPNDIIMDRHPLVYSKEMPLVSTL